VRYLRYLDKYREYQHFDTSIEEILIHHDISRSHDTAKYRDMTTPVSIPCDRSTVNNWKLCDSNENKTSHQNHFCKLVICLQFAHALISVLWKRCISSSLWRFVNFRDLTVVRLIRAQCACHLRYRPMRGCCWRSFVCAVYHALFTNLDYTSFAKVLQYCIMTNIEGRAPKCRRAPENYPIPTPTGLRTNVSYALLVSQYSIPETVSLSWLQFQVLHNTSNYKYITMAAFWIPKMLV